MAWHLVHTLLMLVAGQDNVFSMVLGEKRGGRDCSGEDRRESRDRPLLAAHLTCQRCGWLGGPKAF